MLNTENAAKTATDIAIKQITDYITHSKIFLDCIDSRETEMSTEDERTEIIDTCFNIAYDEMIELEGEFLDIHLTISGNSSSYSDSI